MISFTGSTRAGKAISRAASDTLKRVTLELGGKGANLIFADADERAVARGVRDCFRFQFESQNTTQTIDSDNHPSNSGQSCNAPTRMLVERCVYDRAVQIAKEVTEATKVAPAHLSGRHIGPVVSKQQWDKIQVGCACICDCESAMCV